VRISNVAYLREISTRIEGAAHRIGVIRPYTEPSRIPVSHRSPVGIESATARVYGGEVASGLSCELNEVPAHIKPAAHQSDGLYVSIPLGRPPRRKPEAVGVLLPVYGYGPQSFLLPHQSTRTRIVGSHHTARAPLSGIDLAVGGYYLKDPAVGRRRLPGGVERTGRWVEGRQIGIRLPAHGGEVSTDVEKPISERELKRPHPSVERSRPPPDQGPRITHPGAVDQRQIRLRLTVYDRKVASYINLVSGDKELSDVVVGPYPPGFDRTTARIQGNDSILYDPVHTGEGSTSIDGRAIRRSREGENVVVGTGSPPRKLHGGGVYGSEMVALHAVHLGERPTYVDRISNLQYRRYPAVGGYRTRVRSTPDVRTSGCRKRQVDQQGHQKRAEADEHPLLVPVDRRSRSKSHGKLLFSAA